MSYLTSTRLLRIVSPLNLTVRTAQQQDLVDLVEVLSTSFHPPTGFVRWIYPIIRLGIYEDLRQRLRSPLSSSYIFLVAVVSSQGRSGSSSRIVGTVEVHLQPTSNAKQQDSRYPYLSNLAVHAGYRRKGVAHKLLSSCEAILAERGFQHLYLHVLEKNYPARRLYFKAGYRLRQADSFWWCWFLRRPRRLLLQKRLVPQAGLRVNG